MKKILILTLILPFVFTGCVSKKKFTELENKYKECEDKLSAAKLELATCLDDKKSARKEISYLKNTNYKLLNSVGQLSTLSQQEAENLEKSLESIKEKDMQIRTLNEAINKKDSVTLALVTKLKGALGNIADEDIQINVEKGVVYVSISDKLLFESGKYDISPRAKEVLGKVAKVVKSNQGIDIMVEGHTDDRPVLESAPYKDNWDLSTLRATAVVRVLQNEFGVKPSRMTAAGRGEYVPVVSNETSEGRAKNRRTRIIVLPKLDEFFQMIEEGMEEAKENAKAKG